jgi:hypothetical protein
VEGEKEIESRPRSEMGEGEKKADARGKNDPLKVRPSSLFILFRWSSNSTAPLRSLSI